MERVRGALGVLTWTLPKLMKVGLGVMAGGLRPVPPSLTIWERRASEMVRTADSALARVGEKSTEMAQEEPAASWLPQLLTALKSVRPVPAETATEVPMLVRGWPPELVRVTAMGVAVWPTTVLGKRTWVAERVSVGPLMPVPVSCAV